MLNKDKMRIYQQNRRKRLKSASQGAAGCKPIVVSDVNHPVNQIDCKPEQSKPDIGTPESIKSGVVRVIPEGIADKFTGSPVHCLPVKYDREEYLALLPGDVRKLVLDTNTALVASHTENAGCDLDLRIARAVHYQEVACNV